MDDSPCGRKGRKSASFSFCEGIHAENGNNAQNARKGAKMTKYIELDKAVETLEKLKAERERRNCSRSQLIEAQAFAYAIAVLKQLPVYEKRR